MLKRFILLLLLGSLAPLTVWAQANVNPTKYKTGAGDGFDASRSESFVWEIFQPEAVCVGEDALFTMQVEGSLLYSYRWYKVGEKTKTLSTESYLRIPNCQVSQNGTKYLCEVKDLNTGETFLPEDTFRLVVKTKPVVRWLNTRTDTTLCLGQHLELRVLPVVPGEYVYTWFGDGIVGNAGSESVTVSPEQDMRYRVSISNGYCVSDTIGMRVKVRRSEVKLPQDIQYTVDGEVNLKPSAGEGGTLTWYAGGNKYTNREVFNWTMPADVESTTVKVVRTVNGCEAADSITILNETAMKRFFGGANDGFVESQQKISVSGITPVLSEVCFGDPAYFTCNVGTIGTYTYQWYKVGPNGKDEELMGCTSNLLTLSETDDMATAGKYYCVVYDLDTKQSITTDPATLVILDRPEINIPMYDTAICLGEQVVLKASREADEGEIFRWNGVNILSNPSDQQITVSPTEKSVYQLVVMRGTCMASAEITVDVRTVQLHTRKVADVLLGDTLRLSLPTETGVRYLWTYEGKNTTGTSLTIKPTENTVVHVEKRLGSCKAADSTLVYVKEYGIATGQDKTSPEDGYAESVLPFRILSLDCPKQVCVGDEAVMNVEIVGYDVYQYTWKKRLPDGSEITVDTVRQHTIAKAKKSDAGIYFCEVKDVRSGDVLVSDELTLEVLPVPMSIISFVQPDLGEKESIWVCAGTSLVMKADQQNGCTYLWEGVGLLGETDKPTVNALPESTATYSLVVSNGICSDISLVQVNVWDISVDIPEVKIVNEGEAFVVEPLTEIPAGGKLTWSFNRGTEREDSRFVSNGISQSGYLRVTLKMQECSVEDSMRIYVRGFNTFRGGDEDGYVESNSSFMIQELHYPQMVCEHSDADFSIRVKGSGIYSYNWKQVGLMDPISTEALCSLTDCSMAMSGQQYYCQVTDLMLGKTLTSDTITLQVRKGPKAVINYPDRGKSYCIGSKIRLDARKSEESKESPDIEYVYSWEGERITATESPYAVEVQPSKSQVYTLKVSSDICSDYDTILIKVIDPRVSIPSVIYAEEGKPLPIRADVWNASVNATVNWWHNALFTPNQNPFVIKDIKESATVVAEVVDQGCKFSDTARVYVRTNRYFAGGDDDGFMESCNIPEINPDITTVLGCGGVDSVEMVVLYTGDPRTFVWQKYDKTAGRFVDVAETPGLSGLGTPSLKIKPLVPDFFGEYRCVLTNDCGSTYSLTYKVSNGNPPQVAVHNDTISLCEGLKDQDLQMILAEDDITQEVKYRWYKKNPLTGVTEQFTPEASFNKKILRIPEVTPSYDALYLMEAEGICGVAKDSVRLIVSRKVAFRVQPKDTLVCYNTNVLLHAHTQEGKHCKFILKKVVPDNSYFEGFRVEKAYPASTVNRYEFKPALMEDNGWYVWTVKSSCGDSITSRMFRMTVEKPLQFLAQTADTTVCLGTQLTLEAMAESPDCPDSKITYEWSKLSEGVLNYRTSSFSMTVTSATEGAYLCAATNVCGRVEMDRPIEVDVHPELVITHHPEWNQAGICEDGMLELKFMVNLTSIVDSVRWYRDSGGSSFRIEDEGDRIVGADDYVLHIDSIRPAEAGLYYARVYNVCGGYKTINVDIKVDEKARIVKPIEDFFNKEIVCYDEEAELQVTATGKTVLLYTWFKGEELIGKEGNTQKVVFDQDAVYRCSVHNHCGDASSTWSVHVVTLDTFRLHSTTDTHYCEGDDGVRLVLVGSDKQCVYRLFYKDSEQSTPIMVQELGGGDAPFEGGSLDFGIQPAGLYYVMAYDSIQGCEGRMPGDVTVIMDSLPKVFNVEIGYPICEGSLVGKVLLNGSQKAMNNRYQYTLESKGSTEWTPYSAVVTGTGDTLVWNGVVTGLYRVKAVDRQTGCSTVMNGEADLSVHPNPVACELLQTQGDTMYCEDRAIDVVLKMEQDCFTSGYTYTLMKDNRLTTDVRTDNSGWAVTEEGIYAVMVRNEWGCEDTTGTVRVHQYPLPDRKTVDKNRFYCDGEESEGSTALITLNLPDEAIRYTFFRKGEKDALEEKYKQPASDALMIEVPLVDADYYVIATDTATGCTVSMTDTVSIRGSRMELSHTPVTMKRSETAIRLEVSVKNAQGTLKVEWEPEDQVMDLSDPLRPWMNMEDLTKKTFTVTVSDTVCTKQETIMVSLEGQALTATIIDPKTGAVVPNDTLWVCEGATYSLDAVVLGGGNSFAYEWLLDGTSIGSKKKLTGAVAAKAGELVFLVNSNGRVARDTVRIELYPAPGKDLAIAASDLCLVPGDTLKMNLSETESSVTYTLEYGTNKEVFKSTGVTAAGTSSGLLTLMRTFTEERSGYYRVKTEKAYGGTTCSSVTDPVQVGVGVPNAGFFGGGEYCFHTGADSIVLDSTVMGATYWLLYKSADDAPWLKYDLAGEVAGNNDSLFFIGDWPTGSYRIASHWKSSSCVDTLAGEVKIRHLNRPKPGTMISDEMEYCYDPDQELAVSISLNGVEAGVKYTLYRQNGSNVEVESTITALHDGDLEFGDSFDQLGRYFSVADNGKCRDTVGAVLIGQIPELKVTLVKADTGYCVGSMTDDVHLVVYPANTDAHYYIYPTGAWSHAAEFKHLADDTLYFKGKLDQGDYIVKAKVASCEKDVASFRITEYELPKMVNLLEPDNGCEGSLLSMGVKDSEKGVLYELSCGVDNDHLKVQASKPGDGKDLVIATADTAGTYYLQARNTQTGCLQELNSYSILKRPKNFDLVATDTVYCAFDESSGTQFALSGTEAGIVYMLQQYDTLTKQYVDIQPEVALYGLGVNTPTYFNGIFGVGKYRVRTTTCEGSLIGNELEIRKIELPIDTLPVDVVGSGCEDSTMLVRIQRSEIGVKYTLWKDNQLFSAANEQTGNGSDLTWKIDKAAQGVYEIRADRKGATRDECASILDRTIRVEEIPLLRPLVGDSPICGYTTTTLEIPVSDPEVIYTLHRKVDSVQVMEGIAGRIKVLFEETAPGSYFAKASRGDCRITTPVFVLDSLAVPDIDAVQVDNSDCIVEGTGWITIKGMTDTLKYHLECPDGTVEKFSKVANEKEFTKLGVGDYILKVQDMKNECFSLSRTISLNQQVPAGDTLIGPFGYCESKKSGVQLKLNHTTMNVLYMIKSVEGDTIESFFGGGGRKAFSKYYKAQDDGSRKEYVFVAENHGSYAGCSVEKHFWIEQYPSPDLSEKLALQETGALCAGNEYHISVEDVQENMWYVLYHGKVPVDTVSYEDPNFRAVNEAGDYTVVPMFGGVCGTKPLDTLFHLNTLPSEIFVEQPANYCHPADATEEGGISLKIYNTESKVRYVLNNGTADVDTLYGNLQLSYQEFEPQPAGNYTVTATDTLTGCSAVVGTGVIEKFIEPKRFVCGEDGKRCTEGTAPVGITDSEADVDYYLYRDGKRMAGPTTGGAGLAVSFGDQTESGIYQILARSKQGCSVYMKDSVLVYPTLTQDTLVVKGSYCEEQNSDISFRLRRHSYMWSYFIERAEDKATSDTLAGGEDAILQWVEVGGKDIRSGKYRLLAMNPCGDVRQLDSVKVDTNFLPRECDIVGGDFTVCAGDSGSIVLSATQAETEYDLMFTPEYGNGRFLLTKTGTGFPMELAKVDQAGVYTVIGRMTATGCMDTVAQVKVSVIEGIETPNVSATDVCLTDMPDGQLEVSLGRKQDNVSYYLQRIHGTDTVMVDSIRWGVGADVNRQEFNAQQKLGVYRVVAQGPTCRKTFDAARIGEAANNQLLDPAGLASICGGKAKEIGLEGSETGVKYEVFRKEKKPYEDKATYISTNIVAEGTGAALKLGSLRDAGVYVVEANNGCRSWLQDTLKLEVNESYKIQLREYYIVCSEGDSTKIEILGRTNPNPNAKYMIYEPGSSTYSETVLSGNQEASVESSKWYSKPGFYRIVGTDGNNCPEVDSVEIKVLPMPDVYPFVLRGNKFLCDNATKKELVVEGAQKNVEYHLYRTLNGGLPEAVTMKVAQSGDMEITFEAYQEGVYYVMAQYNNKESNKGCPVRMDGEVELSPAMMHQYALEAVKDVYCYNASQPQGAVQLVNSDVNVSYQLYRNGEPYGSPKNTGTAGVVLKWDNLDGGIPKMSENSVATPVTYTVRGSDLTTGCEVEMNGAVDIIADRTIIYNTDQLKKEIPTCLGGKLDMVVSAYGGQRIDYQWKRGSEELSDGNHYYYTIAKVEEKDMGLYYCELTNTCGTVKTESVEVKPSLLIDRPGVGVDSMVICNLAVGETRSVVLSSRATNADKWTWYKNGDLLEDEVFQSMDVPISLADGAGIYTCRASNECGSVWDTCVVMVDSTPRIELLAPIHRDTLCFGTSWELQVKSVHPIVWMRGNEVLPCTDERLEIASVALVDRGVYSVASHNRCGDTKEEVAMLVVDSLIEVISQQDRFHICRQSGEWPHLYIQTTPKERVYYRWEDREGNVLSTTNELNNIDLNKYSHLVDTFRVYYGNRCEDSYRDITLVTSDYIQFKQPEEELAACVMDGLTDTVLRIEVLNDQEVTYKWFRSNRSDGFASRDSVGNADTLVIPLSSTHYAGFYYCYMANHCVDTVTRLSNVRIDSIPEVFQRLAEFDTLCSGSEMKLQVSASASAGSVKYTWYVKKKGKSATMVSESQYFGLSQSEYKCYVDTTYHDALIWCDVSTFCHTSETDTLHLAVLPAPVVSMDVLSELNCEGEENEIYVKLDNGNYPWRYKYSVDGEERIAIREVKGDTDTVKVKEAGIYRVYWMADAKCTLTGKELAMTEYNAMKRSKYTLEAVDYTDPVCPNSEVTLRVKISGGLSGPWNIGIYRASDGELASELGFEKEYYVMDSIQTYQFKIQKDEIYFAQVTNLYGAAKCEAIPLVKEVELKVIAKPEISMNELKPEDRVIGACKNLSLRELFNVQPTKGGWYVVDTLQVAGDWLMKPQEKKYKIGYRIYQDGCQFDGYNLGEIEVKALPELEPELLDNHVLCSSIDQAQATFKAKGAAPIKVTYQIFDMHKNGQLSLTSTSEIQLDKDYMPNFYYDEELAGKIVKVIRVEDKYKCLQPEVALPKDTVLFNGRPEFKVYAKAQDSTEWQTGKNLVYWIRRGSSVDLQVELTEGQKPWTLNVVEQLIPEKSFTVADIPTDRYTTQLDETGLYSINVKDKHCLIDVLSDQSFVEVHVMDTVYLSLKAYLQGPWSEVEGKMVSAVADRIDKRGLTNWPDIGRRQIIDWVMVELWQERKDGPLLWDSQWCLLLDDGTVVDKEGRSALALMGKTASDRFRIAIRPRNHLTVWSKPVSLYTTTQKSPLMVDFTKMATLYMEPDEKDVSKYAYMDNFGRIFLYAGEVNSNRIVTSFDPNRITREVLSLDKFTATGELRLDVNYNGRVEWPGYNVDATSGKAEYLDWSIMVKNRSKYSIVPERELKW